MGVVRKLLGKREARIIKRMKSVGGMAVTTIAKVTERHKKSIYGVLSGKAHFAKRGRKEKLQKKDVNHIVATLRSMVRKARARWEITLAMLKKRAKCMVDDKVVRKALQKKNIKFRKLRSKPLLTKNDIKERYNFAKKYRGKTRAWWLKNIHLHIVLKNFPVYTSAKASCAFSLGRLLAHCWPAEDTVLIARVTSTLPDIHIEVDFQAAVNFIM